MCMCVCVCKLVFPNAELFKNMPEGKPEAERAILNLLKCFEALYFFDKVGVPGQ